MARLEDLRPTTAVRDILPAAQIAVVTTQWLGSDALELTYKDSAGRVGNVLLYRHGESRLEVVEQGRPWSFDGDRKAPSRRLQALPRQHTAAWTLGRRARCALSARGDHSVELRND